VDNTSLFILLKNIHMITVATTLVGFLVRAWWMLTDSKLLFAKPVKIFPHVNDTLLIGSALGAGYVSGQLPFVDSWLTAKLIGLVAYIVLSSFALRYGKTKSQRIVYLVLAFVAIGYVLAVAVCRNPLACMS
jgi:uncharacterized membrane protein SirB2|tara:strand:+ start:6172 stop:6567 length:396 start_codon:yes stop_codon:yes gene_type:complete